MEEITEVLYIGIDTGVNTGICVWNKTNQEINLVSTMKIHKAIKLVSELSEKYEVHVLVEDARLRKWFGNNSQVKKQGAGSVKRDAKIWDDFLSDLLKLKKIKSYKMIHPIKGCTKVNEVFFKKITGYQGRTSEHARDATMIVFKK